MINVNRIETIKTCLSATLEYGISHQYSLNVIQELISYSGMFRKLENGDDSFLRDINIVKEIENIYLLDEITPTFKELDSRLLWVAEAYTNLFFKYHKSIYYIFLYIPLEEMIALYHLYHEMDWSQLFNLFDERVKETTLLKKLIQKHNLSINKLSQLSSISENTIKYYCLSDKNLYEAKYKNIDAIALALKINSNVFLKEIHNYTYSGDYDKDKKDPLYRSYLGLYLASYYYLPIEQRKYQYDNSSNMFISGNERLKVLWTNSNAIKEESELLNEEIVNVTKEASEKMDNNQRKQTILVIFEYNQISINLKSYLSLMKYGFEKIFILNEKLIMCIYDNYWKSYITPSIMSAAVTKAKKASGGDFAVLQ